MINLFPGLEHTASHIMGVDHARSNYLNCKEGDGKDKSNYLNRKEWDGKDKNNYLNRKEGDGKDKANDWINAHDLKVKDKIMIMIINQK